MGSKRLNRIYYRSTIKEFRETKLYKQHLCITGSKINLICCNDGNIELI